MNMKDILVDLLQFFLSTYISHIVMDNPFMGAASYLIFLCCRLAFRFMRTEKHAAKSRIKTLIFIALYSLIAICGALWIIYPFVMGNALSIIANVLIWLLIGRVILPRRLHVHKRTSFRRDSTVILLLQIGTFVPYSIMCIFFMDILSAIISMVAYWLIALLMWKLDYGGELLRYDMEDSDSVIYGFSSYNIFTNMSLYSNIAIDLGIMLYVCYMFFLPGFSIATLYPAVIAWALLAISAAIFSYNALLGLNKAVQLTVFISGAALWVVSSYMMFIAKSIIFVIPITFIWAVSFAATSAALTQFNEEFRLLGKAIDNEPSEQSLFRRTVLIKSAAFFFSGFIMVLLLTVWNFVIPRISAPGIDLMKHFRSWMILLPIVFMVTSLVFALRQPMTKGSVLRIDTILAQGGTNDRMKKKVATSLASKTKVRFGTKILVLILKLVYRHKVVGKENLDPKNYPAIFVCNHGHIYGPIVAVVYMPTYFRPWIDDRMINKDLIVDHMYEGTFKKIPLLGRTKRFTEKVARPIVWALESYDPIPVERSDIRQIMNTMKLTADAMLEGDNVLIFPENPAANESNDYLNGTVGEFFTGFTQIAANYYKKTGKAPCFYPLFADKLNKTFNIGKPIFYDPDRPKGEERERLTKEIRSAMLALSSSHENS